MVVNVFGFVQYNFAIISKYEAELRTGFDDYAQPLFFGVSIMMAVFVMCMRNSVQIWCKKVISVLSDFKYVAVHHLVYACLNYCNIP